MTQAKIYPGPNGVGEYDVSNPKEMQAWEDAWAQHLGQDMQDLTNDRPAPRWVTVPAQDRTPEQIAQAKEAKAAHAEAIAYIREYTGTWGFILDLRSDRRWGTAYMSLSPRQVEVVLNSKAREAQWAAERTERTRKVQSDGERPASALSAPAVFQRVTTITEDGFYRHGEDIVKVQVAVHGSGNLYAKRLIVHEHGSASWEYTPGLVTQLKESERLTYEQAVEFGRLYGVCGICGRTLTDEGSIAAGIGPICAGKQGWD